MRAYPPTACDIETYYSIWDAECSLMTRIHDTQFLSPTLWYFLVMQLIWESLKFF